MTRPESYDQLRREVRSAVFRAGRLRADGQGARADDQLADELAAAQARLAADGLDDAATIVRGWFEADEAAFAQAQLTSDLLLERLPQPTPPPGPPKAAEARPSVVPPRPPATVPGLADLLDDMLAQERRSKPRPS